jgi:hypothetical protein
MSPIIVGQLCSGWCAKPLPAEKGSETTYAFWPTLFRSVNRMARQNEPSIAPAGFFGFVTEIFESEGENGVRSAINSLAQRSTKIADMI